MYGPTKATRRLSGKPGSCWSTVGSTGSFTSGLTAIGSFLLECLEQDFPGLRPDASIDRQPVFALQALDRIGGLASVEAVDAPRRTGNVQTAQRVLRALDPDPARADTQIRRP